MLRKLSAFLVLVAGVAVGVSVPAKDFPDAVSNSAVPGWVMAGVNQYTTTYFDPSTTSKADNIARMWTLIDYETPPVQNFTKPYRSHREQTEFDCKNGKMRHVALIFHSDNMGKGEAVYSENVAGTWTAISSGSIAENLSKSACANR